MDLNDLQKFVAIADCGGVSSAATRLQIAKSSLSRGLTRLEHDLGVKLVHRTTRRLSLSTAGHELYARVAPLVTELERSMNALPEQDEAPSGLLRVTLPLDFAVFVLASIVTRFSERYPKVKLELSSSNRFVDLLAERFDVALRISQGRLQDSALVARSVASLALRLYAAPGYLSRAPSLRRPEDLVQQRWVGQAGRRTLQFVAGDAKRAVRVDPALSCDDMFFKRALLKEGAGVGLLPAFLAQTEVMRGELTPVLPRWAVPSGRVWLVRPSAGKVPAKVLAFERFVVEGLGAHRQL